MKKYVNKSDALMVGITLGITVLIVLVVLFMMITHGSHKPIQLSDDAINIGDGPIMVVVSIDGQEYHYHLNEEKDIERHPDYIIMTVDGIDIQVDSKNIITIDYSHFKTDTIYYPFKY